MANQHNAYLIPRKEMDILNEKLVLVFTYVKHTNIHHYVDLILRS